MTTRSPLPQRPPRRRRSASTAPPPTPRRPPRVLPSSPPRPRPPRSSRRTSPASAMSTTTSSSRRSTSWFRRPAGRRNCSTLRGDDARPRAVQAPCDGPKSNRRGLSRLWGAPRRRSLTYARPGTIRFRRCDASWHPAFARSCESRAPGGVSLTYARPVGLFMPPLAAFGTRGRLPFLLRSCLEVAMASGPISRVLSWDGHLSRTPVAGRL